MTNRPVTPNPDCGPGYGLDNAYECACDSCLSVAIEPAEQPACSDK